MSEGIQFVALRSGEIDCMVNYTGNIWTLLMKRRNFPDRETMLEDIKRYLREEYGGVVCLGPLGFENAYALAMRRDVADRMGIRTIDDLKDHARGLKLASDFQFLGRPEWFKVRDAYELEFKDSRSIDPGLMYDAIKAGDVDVITAYTSDGRIEAYDLVILEDPRNAFPPYDAVLLVSQEAASRPEFIPALEPLIGAIDEKMIRRANYRVDVEKWSAVRAAEELFEKVRRGR